MGETEDYTEDIALIAHATTHKSGGSDEIDISGLAPMLHALSHKLGGSDEIDISGLIFKSCCHAYLSSAQNIPTGAATLIELDATVIDRNSDFNTGAYKFVCPFDGVYLALANIDLGSTTADKWHWTYIYKNTVQVAQANVHSAFTYRVSASTFALLSCVTGDEITIREYHNEGGDRALTTGSKATFLIVLSLYAT